MSNLTLPLATELVESMCLLDFYPADSSDEARTDLARTKRRMVADLLIQICEDFEHAEAVVLKLRSTQRFSPEGNPLPARFPNEGQLRQAAQDVTPPSKRVKPGAIAGQAHVLINGKPATIPIGHADPTQEFKGVRCRTCGDVGYYSSSPVKWCMCAAAAREQAKQSDLVERMNAEATTADAFLNQQLRRIRAASAAATTRPRHAAAIAEANQ